MKIIFILSLIVSVTLVACKKEVQKPISVTEYVCVNDTITVSDVGFDAEIIQITNNEMVVNPSKNIFGSFTIIRESVGIYTVEFDEYQNFSDYKIYVLNNNVTTTVVYGQINSSKKIGVYCLKDGYLKDNVIQTCRFLLVKN